MKKDIKKRPGPSGFERMSTLVTRASGSTPAFLIALLTIMIWGALGPVFDFSDTWQLVINTSTTIITFLMVFVIQRSQNKDSVAIHLKLNELIVAHEMANNKLVNADEICEDDLRILHKYYSHLAEMSETELPINQSHSLEKAHQQHQRKSTQKKEELKPGASKARS